MRTARRYFASEIYRSSFVVLLALLGLFTFFALIEDLDNVGSKFSLANLFYLQALQLPTRLYDLLPIGLLIGAVLALAGLAQRNELLIFRVSGVSGLRLLVLLWSITIPWVAGAFLLSEYITPAAEIQYSETSLRLFGRAGGGRMNSGYWFKEQTSDGGERIINILRLQPAGGVEGVTLYEFNADKQFTTLSKAQSGHFENNTLILKQVQETHLDADAEEALGNIESHVSRPLISTEPRAQRILPTSLSPERLIARILTPERMSASVLLDYIDYLERNNLQTHRQVVALWRKLAYPFTLFVMITIAAPVGFMQTRRGGVGAKVFVGILLGVAFFMVNQLALNVGMLSNWPPWITAIMPNLAALILALLALFAIENRHNARRFMQAAAPLTKPAAP